MAGLPNPVGSPRQERIHKSNRILLMVKECIGNYMSKDETQRYLQSRYQFTRQDINNTWDSLERCDPDSIRLHNERIRERNLRTCERVASSTFATRGNFSFTGRARAAATHFSNF